MSEERNAAPEGPADEVNRVFAATERWGVRVGLAAVVVTFGLYVTGLVPPYLAPERLMRMASDDVDAFVRTYDVPVGWQWLRLLHHGDFLALGGLVVLLGTTVLALVAVLPALVRRRDYVFVAIVLLQLALFALAGSGLPGGP